MTGWLQSVKLIDSGNVHVGGHHCTWSESDSIEVIYCFLFARYRIWQALLNETVPKQENFLRFVKSPFTIEIKGRGYRKMGTPGRVYVQCLFSLPLAASAKPPMLLNPTTINCSNLRGYIFSTFCLKHKILNVY